MDNAATLFSHQRATSLAQAHESHERLGMAVELSSLAGEHAFHLELRRVQLSAHVSLGSAHVQAHVARRGAALAAQAGCDAVMLARFSQPFAYTSGPLAHTAFRPGDTLLAPMDAAFECIHPTAGTMHTLWLQRAALPALLGSPARRFGACPRLDVLFGYATSIPQHGTLDASLAGQAAVHLTELLALALRTPGGAANDAPLRGERAARLAALRAHVARAYRNPRLSVAEVAQSQHMSMRQVQRLFEDAGTTFTAHLQALRLAHVHRALTDPARAHLLVATLAYEAGFSDLTAFNRLFKQRFGATPSQTRAAAHR